MWALNFCGIKNGDVRRGGASLPVFVQAEDGKVVALDLDSDATVGDLAAELGRPLETLRLSFAGTDLTDPNQLLADAGIAAESTVQSGRPEPQYERPDILRGDRWRAVLRSSGPSYSRVGRHSVRLGLGPDLQSACDGLLTPEELARGDRDIMTNFVGGGVYSGDEVAGLMDTLIERAVAGRATDLAGRLRSVAADIVPTQAVRAEQQRRIIRRTAVMAAPPSPTSPPTVEPDVGPRANKYKKEVRKAAASAKQHAQYRASSASHNARRKNPALRRKGKGFTE